MRTADNARARKFCGSYPDRTVANLAFVCRFVYCFFNLIADVVDRIVDLLVCVFDWPVPLTTDNTEGSRCRRRFR
jgi:hypothetical protein